MSGLTRRASHLADQGAKLCGAQISIDPTENGDSDDDVTQDAAQIVKGVDTNCRRQSSRDTGDTHGFSRDTTLRMGSRKSGKGSLPPDLHSPRTPQRRQRLPVVNSFRKWLPDQSRPTAGRCAREELTEPSPAHGSVSQGPSAYCTARAPWTSALSGSEGVSAACGLSSCARRAQL